MPQETMDHDLDRASDQQESGPVADRDELHRELQAFFDDYALALTSGAGDVIAAMWEVPALVLGDAGEKAVTSTDEVAAFFSGAKEQYNARGITDTRPDLLRSDWLSSALVSADVRWPYFDVAGNEVGEEHSSYILKRDRTTGMLKIRVAVIRDDGTRH
jgi:hypothetical protein